MRLIPFVFSLLLLTACNQQSQNQQIADTLLINGQVYFPEGKFASADIAMKDGRILEIGENLTERYSADSLLEMDGTFIMPGFVDAHAHLTGIGESVQQLNFLQDTSWQQLLGKVEAKVAEVEEGEWILGRGWHQEKWTDQPTKTIEGFPSHEQLSAISPNHPVMLNHASGHGILVNAKAMELAGINAETPTPEGGLIVKDEAGKPIGVFQENAEALIASVYHESRATMTVEEKQNEWAKIIQIAQKHCVTNGLTGMHDAGISLREVNELQQMATNGELLIRLYSMVSQGDLQAASKEELEELKSFTHPMYNCRAVKAYVDGALGSRGAWLLEEYSDQPGYFGENVTPLESLKRTAERCKEYGLQLGIHAIGDRGNREVMNIFEQVMDDELSAARWRIEHAQHLHPQEIERMGSLGIIASMQTVHCTSDAPYVEKRLGEQRAEEGAYVWQKLLNNNVYIANGTDAPVERVNPFENIYAAVTRQPASDEAFYPAQKLTRKQAIDSYTIWNAYASFQENEKGSIEVGKLADFTVVDRNLLTCPEKDISTTEVLFTIVGGVVQYENNN